MIIRDATAADWPAIWPFLREIVAAGEAYCWPRDTSEEAARAWWTGKPGGRVFVAVDERVDDDVPVPLVVGTAELHPNQPAAGAHVANAGFMVDPAHAGRGIGRALAQHVLGAACQEGYRAMQFNAVVETNTAAVRLWRSLGFDVLATVPRAFDHPSAGPVGLHVMWRDLSTGPS
ncbi:GCN5-related protein N-acetyltransferase [Beutenbergia cavernae DSM 12333]|uniref:GCN5-related protein N-acetyltransferase n=1 Tax=Beutenbergia cavernae (strain ATCC BAA-8 / DSM 12333 / CCUG 43141 / JCM 11478 / NBRC 16432 / NCIMB 13614 / HKI 0122) TaxID=471853 RepID=C5BUT9_BEUC1|nr:GNAT family N-acetyltransferase [Beutenbergia cavernae]ACQ78313.1 GCN5-related protein N-acetyltransferase [Beutenbergia cavernae DSM 12333]